MRPRRLEVEGFTAFRDKTLVDFEGADLFAFVGPTGSGKSSLVDALLFALYGVVPRYGDKRAVEPVVSLGKNEARVRFDFSVGDVDYTAARVVRRTKTGASTSEARLEGGAEAVMGADEVTDAVEELLGLGFDHFTKCVVLPQGQFAAFLHDSSAKRQELLRQLLDLGRYRRVRDLAVNRQKAAENMVEILSTQLEDLSFASALAQTAAEARRDKLAAVRDQIDTIGPELEQLRTKARTDGELAERARRDLLLVRSIKPPADLPALSASADESAGRLAEAEAALQEAIEQRQALDSQSDKMLDAATIAGLSALHGNLKSELVREEETLLELAAAQKAADEARQTAAASDDAVKVVVGKLESIRAQHAAHSLARQLAVGEPCPVCRREVESLPADEMPEAVDAIERELQEKREVAVAEAAAAADASEALAAAQSRIGEARSRVASLRAQLADQPDLGETLRLQAARQDLDQRIRAASAAEQEARGLVEVALKQTRAVGIRLDEARRAFDSARDGVASLSPPLPARQRLDADWAQLSNWAEEKGRDLAESAEAMEQSVKEATAEIASREDQLVESLADLGVEVGGRKARDVCVEALAVADQQVERIVEARARAGSLKKDRDGYAESGVVAKALARHLAANGFEGWLMAEALVTLVDGANLRLDDLSGGAFSLELDKRDFRIVDHRNADERRSVKTLSGGETFLVSLALALSLAEQLATMSVHGVARLESMFLDEGFGSLDTESLEVVASVIHELGADGRTIGLITHVKDLAEQVPVRFEVRKGPGGATVERVDA